MEGLIEVNITDNKPEIKIGDTDITDMVLSYSIEQDGLDKYLTIKLPIRKLNLKAMTNLDNGLQLQ